MPPKRVTRGMSARQKQDSDDKSPDEHPVKEDESSETSEDEEEPDSSPEPGDKRKAAEVDDKDAPSAAATEDAKADAKKPKMESTTTNTNDDGESDEKSNSSNNNNSTIIKWLLSEPAFTLAFPTLPPGHGEIDWSVSSRRKEPPASDAGHQSSPGDETQLLTYPDSALTPFQNLVCALILSKPLSHRLGTRTINTLLNPPFGLRTVEDLDEAGYEGRRKVMWEARTQHKEKTAVQLGDLVEGVRGICGGDEGPDDLEGLEGLRKQLKGLGTEEAQEKVKSVLTEGIKGVGPTGVGIFLRRVQGEWGEVFPFVDERGLQVAREFGLVRDGGGAEELKEVAGGDRGRFVRLLDVLVGLQLEKKVGEAMEAAGVRVKGG